MTPNQRKHFKYVRDVMHGEAQQKKESVFCEYCGGNDDAEFGLPTDHCTDCARPQSSTQTEALKALVHEMEYVLSCINENKIPFDGDDFHEALRLGKESLAQPEQDKERCVGCEACIDTACGRDECPKGWPKAAQPEQEQSGFFSREAMKAHSDFHVAQPEQEPDCYVRKVIDALYENSDPVSVEAAELLERMKQPCICNEPKSAGTHRTDGPCLAPQRTWVGLTDEEINDLVHNHDDFDGLWEFTDAVEAKLKEKNT